MLRRCIASVATLLCLLALFCCRSTATNRAGAAEPEKDANLKTSSADQPTMMAHMVFFTLKESSDENRKKLIDAAKKYLGGHPGEIYFSIGEMANLKEPVSVTDFDVALHIVFENKAAHDQYLSSARHKRFSAVAKKLDKSVRVFDSKLVPTAEPPTK